MVGSADPTAPHATGRIGSRLTVLITSLALTIVAGSRATQTSGTTASVELPSVRSMRHVCHDRGTRRAVPMAMALAPRFGQ